MTATSASAAIPAFRLAPMPQVPPVSVGNTVYEQILDAIQRGDLRGGEHLHDLELAAQLGVSRTPVREALLRLREIGVVEFAAARYTRVAVIDREETINAMTAWVTVYRALAVEVVTAGVPQTTIDAMRQAHGRFMQAGDPYNLPALILADAEFYEQLPRHSTNKPLLRCVENTVHVLRIGLLNLPEPIEPVSVGQAQLTLIRAAETRDPAVAHQAFSDLSGIRL